jgi:hypothetical protein
MKRYVVTGEYVTMTTADPASGQRVLLGFYRNALLPEDLEDRAVEHHLSTGQIKAVSLNDDGSITDYEDERQTNPPEITDGLGEPNTNAQVTTPDDGDKVSGQPVTTEPTKAEVVAGDDVPEPRKNADRADWVDYAVSKGGDRAEIEEKKVSRADLIATWGTPK